LAGGGGDCVRQSELEHRQRVQHNGVTSIAGDGIAAQAVEERTQVNQNSHAGITGDRDSAVKGKRLNGL